jgi:hypothetical protein
MPGGTAAAGAARVYPRTKGFRAYPLKAVPRDWTVDASILRDATLPGRVSDNIVQNARAGVTSSYVALFAGGTPPLVRLRLAKLSVDAIEKLNTKTGKEGMVEVEDDEVFADSVHFVVDTKQGLAVGEYRPNALSVLGRWPGRLVSTALANYAEENGGDPNPVEFEPFPTTDFLARAVGRQVHKVKLKMGPVAPREIERAGIGSTALEEISLEGSVLEFELGVTLEPAGALKMGLLDRLREYALRVKELGATQLKVTLEDKEAFDLLDENLVYYATSVEVTPETPPAEIRDRILGDLSGLLVRNQKDLLKMID